MNSEIIFKIRQLISSSPFTPFTLETVDGRNLRVPTSAHAALSPSGGRIFVFGDEDHYEVVSPSKITRLDMDEIKLPPPRILSALEVSQLKNKEEYDRREAATAEWINTAFSDSYDIYPERVGPHTRLYSTLYGGTLYTQLLDGYIPAEQPDWAKNRSKTPSTLLFTALASLSQHRQAFWALFNIHDGAICQLFGLWGANTGNWLNGYPFHVLQEHPADQSGPSCLVLIFDDHESVVVFEDTQLMDPPYSLQFNVDFYGSESHLNQLLSLLCNHPEPSSGV